MQNKKEKHRPSTKYLYFHKITGPTLLFFWRKNRKINKSVSYLPTKFVFSILVETHFLRLITCPFLVFICMSFITRVPLCLSCRSLCVCQWFHMGRLFYTLRKHAYSNIWKILPPKIDIFRIKNSDIFHISTRGGSNEYPHSTFWVEIRKIMYTPVNPSFTVTG